MRFLKNKILRAQEALKRQTEMIDAKVIIKIEYDSFIDTDCSSESGSQYNTEPQPQPRPRRSPTDAHIEHFSAPKACLKNVAINYGKSIASFAASPLALPYLEALLPKHPHLTLTAFQYFAIQGKSKIGGISSLRSLLLVDEKDNEKVAACKRVFQALGEVFIKYFSVNWILTGRLTQKMIYLKFRAMMLRRIQNPENFTDIKDKNMVVIGRTNN